MARLQEMSSTCQIHAWMVLIWARLQEASSTWRPPSFNQLPPLNLWAVVSNWICSPATARDPRVCFDRLQMWYTEDLRGKWTLNFKFSHVHWEYNYIYLLLGLFSVCRYCCVGIFKNIVWKKPRIYTSLLKEFGSYLWKCTDIQFELFPLYPPF